MKTILILEDNEGRIDGFRRAVAAFEEPVQLIVWRDAPSMMAEAERYFSDAVLISLDHDLNPMPGATEDPGTGVDVARFLGDFMPVCPVLIHSTNVDRVYSMHNELRFAGWMVDRVGPIGDDWIETLWAHSARRLMDQFPNTWSVNLPHDHDERVERMRLSLDGLGLGDAIGEMLSHRHELAEQKIANDELPAGPWFHTDDTEMALSIMSVLRSHGQMHQDALAKRFARRFERDPERGYGRMTRIQMREIIAGEKWRSTASRAFGGQGSLGNGTAMRIAPLGAYFADDLERCADEARASSLVTHTHPEAVAGAIAVAIAAAMSWRLRAESRQEFVGNCFESILRHTPESRVRRGIVIASTTPRDVPPKDVARALGNGSQVTAPDTVPFCLWMAANHPDGFKRTLASTVSVGGDCDTNAAIVCGIVALRLGREGVPKEWLNERETVRV